MFNLVPIVNMTECPIKYPHFIPEQNKHKITIITCNVLCVQEEVTPFIYESYSIKRVTTSWTHGILISFRVA